MTENAQMWKRTCWNCWAHWSPSCWLWNSSAQLTGAIWRPYWLWKSSAHWSARGTGVGGPICCCCTGVLWAYPSFHNCSNSESWPARGPWVRRLPSISNDCNRAFTCNVQNAHVTVHNCIDIGIKVLQQFQASYNYLHGFLVTNPSGFWSMSFASWLHC